ncbi:homocysteine S-methyltransferase [Paenibacillus rhizovicinus]|uniref:S-methylmethionine:homocysteine methyltransferase n=1 Tax=Paenibacillus rhizovicinus TaxID=2704463 RepID=A0A6C0NZZ0_9BACL|nr:homocysteine S-methyltransferase [Paenibacillus rhizovicinus]QHW31788.1 homocysteine S-methyltransferase [Paenibacillus rhizovicinus]
MNPIALILQQYPVLILDGAMATELERHGCDLNDSLWSAKVLMDNPELIGRVHTDYFAAGADAAITASYQATVEGFRGRGLNEAEAVALIRRSVRIAVEARDAFWAEPGNRPGRLKPIVAASVGPYGAFLADGSEYRGDYALTEEELADFHRERMRALIEAGADVLACETIPCLREAKAIIGLLEAEFPGVYAWISFSAKDAQHISSGETIAECAQWLDAHEQVAAVGVNCTPPQYINALVGEIGRHTAKPVIAYPNSGETYDPADKTWTSAGSVDSYGCSAKQWHEAGARLIGGCCRTTPADVKAIAAWVRS